MSLDALFFDTIDAKIGNAQTTDFAANITAVRFEVLESFSLFAFLNLYCTYELYSNRQCEWILPGDVEVVVDATLAGADLAFNVSIDGAQIASGEYGAPLQQSGATSVMWQPGVTSSYTWSRDAVNKGKCFPERAPTDRPRATPRTPIAPDTSPCPRLTTTATPHAI